ncbi:MAG: SEC-C metal-binding domain-containing protein [Nannocystaceae bacterium]|nr:SEC-C metal-binding domain-containing protein [bacterium]
MTDDLAAGWIGVVASKCTVVNPWHWLNEDGSFVDDPKLRSRSLRVAQCIEYGGPLAHGEARETLISCRFRPNRQPCAGLLWVLKQSDDSIMAFCGTCQQDEFLIHEWEDTLWAKGPMEPVGVEELAREAGRSTGSPRVPGPQDHPDLFERALALLGSPMKGAELQALISDGASPMTVLDAVLATLPRPPTKGAVERFLPLLMEAWNATPRPELGGLSPEAVHGGRTPHEHTSPKVGRNAPCPCGSGKKFKRCCGRPGAMH